MLIKTLRYRAVFIFATGVYLFFSVNALLITPSNNTNTVVVKAHLKSVSDNHPARGSLNYDLYLLEDSEHYKIGADWADCFSYEDFKKQVLQRENIIMLIKNDNGFMSCV